MQDGFQEIFTESLEKQNLQCTVWNRSISGATVAAPIHVGPWLTQRGGADTYLETSDIFLVMLGTNDCKYWHGTDFNDKDFEEGYVQLIKHLQKMSPAASIVLVIPPPAWKSAERWRRWWSARAINTKLPDKIRDIGHVHPGSCVVDPFEVLRQDVLRQEVFRQDTEVEWAFDADGVHLKEMAKKYMCHELAVKVRAEAERRRGVLAIDVGPWLRSCSGHFTLMSSETGTCVSVAHARAHIDAHIDLEFFFQLSGGCRTQGRDRSKERRCHSWQGSDECRFQCTRGI